MIPLGVLFLGALGAASAARAAYRPFRAIVRDGFVSACAGSPGTGACTSAMRIASYRGKAEIFSPVAGKIIQPGGTNPGGTLRIASSSEPIIITYMGDAAKGGLEIQVQGPGQKVHAGQVVALGDGLAMTVEQVVRDASGRLSTVFIEPASWLAARGIRVSAKRRSGQAAQWCDTGRKLTVPQSVGRCGMRLPAPSGMMILPVSVSME